MITTATEANPTVSSHQPFPNLDGTFIVPLYLRLVQYVPFPFPPFTLSFTGSTNDLLPRV